MEATDALRQSMPKADFFDFQPTENTDTSKRLKEINVFFEEGAPNQTTTHPEENNKETNNNHLMMNSVDIVNYVDSNFWSCTDNTILEDLNCWSTSSGQGKGTDNTDGTIYTLTVLNGGEQQWFKHEDKEERLPQTSLDLDSLLNIIPSGFPGGYQPENKEMFEGSFEVKEEQMELTMPQPEYTNNNEWKENNNEVDSLLRNALQGKGFSRYNGIKTEKEIKKEEEEKIINLDAPIMYESPSMHDSDNPSSAQSMDDIFLSHLDVSYPEDYEKLKRIETEVAESVEQYCLDRTYVPTVAQMALDPLLVQNKSTKKYTKRSKTSQSGTSTSSGVRKERSLHYCNICNKGFKDKYSVNVHIRTHTGEKPFTCSLCGKSFRQKAHLAKHYQTHMAQAKNGISSGHKAPKNLVASS